MLTALYIVFKIVNDICLFFFPPLQPVHDLSIILFDKKRQAVFVWQERGSYIYPGFTWLMHFLIIVYKFFDYFVWLFLFQLKYVAKLMLWNCPGRAVAGERTKYGLK